MAAAVRGASIAATAYAVPVALLEGRVSPATARAAVAIGSGVLVTRVLRSHLEEDADDVAWTVAALSAAGGTLWACALHPDLASGLTISYALIKSARQYALPSVPPDGVASLVPTAAVAVASSIMLPAAYLEPHLVHPSMRTFLYYKWITGAGVSLRQWRVPPPGRTLSAGVHPGRSLLGWLLSTALPRTVVLSLRTMGPFYAFWAALGVWQTRNVATTLRHNVQGLLRSVVFQTGYVSTMWAVMLLASRYISHGAISLRLSTALSWMGALWIQVERLPRRIELAAFFVAHACLVMYRRSGVPSHRKAAALLLAAGVAPMVAHWTTGDKGKQNRFVRAVFCE